jgi:hypothetical protein
MHSFVEPLGISTASETALVFPQWVATVFSEVSVLRVALTQ